MISKSSMMLEFFVVMSTRKSFSIGRYTYRMLSVSICVHCFPKVNKVRKEFIINMRAYLTR